ncbi:hypothetical protein WA158_001091 [Blastocystis sp. Blastoise]
MKSRSTPKYSKVQVAKETANGTDVESPNGLSKEEIALGITPSDIIIPDMNNQLSQEEDKDDSFLQTMKASDIIMSLESDEPPQRMQYYFSTSHGRLLPTPLFALDENHPYRKGILFEDYCFFTNHWWYSYFYEGPKVFAIAEILLCMLLFFYQCEFVIQMFTTICYLSVIIALLQMHQHPKASTAIQFIFVILGCFVCGYGFTAASIKMGVYTPYKVLCTISIVHGLLCFLAFILPSYAKWHSLWIELLNNYHTIADPILKRQ